MCALQVLEPNGQVRVDACVNCGNAYTSLAELMDTQSTHVMGPTAHQQQQQQCVLYRQANAMYDVALSQENDALTLSNKGDALMQLCQVSLHCVLAYVSASMCVCVRYATHEAKH